MGSYCNGFRYKTSKKNKNSRRILGTYGPIDQVGTIYANHNDLFLGTTSRFVHLEDCSFAWNTKIYYI